VRGLPETTRAVLLDVEGTVGDVRFVVEVLFPYARTRIGSFVARARTSPEIAAIAAETAGLASVPPGDHDAIVRALEGWSDANAKVGPLKALQGLIWRDGYAAGALRAHLYDDVPDVLRTWSGRRGLRVAVYSSGSVLAQKLYFGHSVAGDLTPLLAAHFDTTVGGKGSAASYERIAAELGLPNGAVSFFSDAPAEIAAARAAGMHAIRVDRARRREESGRDDAGNEWWGSIQDA
jgi:enolase-phosphatase E1